MCGKAALDSKNGALRFTESVRSQPSTSSSSTVPGASVPAALTSASMRPNSSTVRSTVADVSSSFATSVGKMSARRPILETSCLVLSSSSSLLATSATSAPPRARAIAVALPSPLLAPVTSAARPSSPRISFPASLMLCHPRFDAVGTEACHVCELVASSDVSAMYRRFFCQRYYNYTYQTFCGEVCPASGVHDALRHAGSGQPAPVLPGLLLQNPGWRAALMVRKSGGNGSGSRKSGKKWRVLPHTTSTSPPTAVPSRDS